MLLTLNRWRVAPVLAEFLGTGLLVLVALVLSETTAVSYFVGTSVAAALGVMYVIFGGLSGGHFNPAITFGMWTARRIGAIRGVSYIAAQMLGAVASWQLYQYLTNHVLPTKNTPFSWPMLLAELIGTAVLAMGLTAVLMRGLDTLTSALTYATSFFIGVLLAATASAAYINPATALAQRNFSLVYILGPLLGGLIGVNLYMWLFAPLKNKK